MWRGWREKDRLYWSLEVKRRRGRPRMNCQKTILEDIRCMDMTWEEAIYLAEDREGWMDCVARCADCTGMTKYMATKYKYCIINWFYIVIYVLNDEMLLQYSDPRPPRPSSVSSRS